MWSKTNLIMQNIIYDKAKMKDVCKTLLNELSEHGMHILDLFNDRSKLIELLDNNKYEDFFNLFNDITNFKPSVIVPLLILSDIDFLQGLIKVPESLFNCAPDLPIKSVILPDTQELNNNVFSYCNFIEDVRLPKIEYLGLSSFYYCRHLKKLYLGNNFKGFNDKSSSLVNLLSDCFCGCESLEEIIIDMSEEEFTNKLHIDVDHFSYGVRNFTALTEDALKITFLR